MAAGPNWAYSPGVIIVEILSYLSLRDRLRAASICKRWRSCLFHPSLWNSVVFELGERGSAKSKFLADRCGRFVRGAVVKFNSLSVAEVRECGRILAILSENKNLRHFSLQPSSCHIEWPDTEAVHIIDKYLDLIECLIEHTCKLKHLSLGCVEELLVHSSSLLQKLSSKHGSSLQSLHLASVKEDSENYGIIDLSPAKFHNFYLLQSLSLDYDYLTNELLDQFANTDRAKLQKLCINVHGIEADHERITNDTWRKIRNYSPKLEVTLNLIHSYDGVASLLDIFQPAMPLIHFRQFFCSHVNMASISYISSHYRNSLKTLHIVDGLVDDMSSLYDNHDMEDPFVMLAWQCQKLEHFTLMGYVIGENDIVAIARLRGQQLKTLNIPARCISTAEDEEESNSWFSVGCVSRDFAKKVSESLRYDWLPIDDDDLPMAVLRDEADAEAAYMNTLLSDQVWEGD
ncbi:F-box only protein 33-like [Haliotis asinina]|uniref:F-box only protein 33-like n=1 Tax=Haliotis asinina TaxID=109174 RepID=UPI0035318095